MSHEDRVPTDSTAAVERCLDQLRLGRPVIVVDDADRENEADLVMPAQFADVDDIDRNAAHLVHLRFRLDMSQLPRPFQIGAMGRSGWDLVLSRTERLSIEPQP